MQKTSYTLRVSAEEVENWKLAAKKEGRSVSSWIRWRCNGCSGSSGSEGLLGNREVLAARGSLIAAGVRPAGGEGVAAAACKHGVRKGYHCWQCGGVAEVK